MGNPITPDNESESCEEWLHHAKKTSAYQIPITPQQGALSKGRPVKLYPDVVIAQELDICDTSIFSNHGCLEVLNLPNLSLLPMNLQTRAVALSEKTEAAMSWRFASKKRHGE